MSLGYLIRETIGMARGALLSNRLRSLLALLGIVIGVGTVIAMVALINGFQRSFQQSIQSFGNNTIYIRRIRPGVNFSDDIPDSLKQRRAFTMDDARAIRAQCPAVGAIASFKFPYNDLPIGHKDKHTNSTFVYGTDDNYLTTHGYDLASGRFFTSQEVTRNANVAVLGKDTREALFGDASGVGRTIHIGGLPFTVIGEFESKGKFLGNNFDAVACVPASVVDKYWAAPGTAPPWFPKRGELFLDAIAVSPDMNELAMKQIAEVLRVRRHLPSNKMNDFVVFSDDAFLSLYESVTKGIVALILLISSISLLVGGIGVMNIMLVAVTERTREIGVRKALGAPRSAIMLQFLLEAMMLTAVGGILGVLMGWGVAAAVKAATPLPTYVSAWSVALGLGFSAVVGIFFGLYPAMRASRLDPVESLRYE
jgi:putative ABC transport system permease protein